MQEVKESRWTQVTRGQKQRDHGEGGENWEVKNMKKVDRGGNEGAASNKAYKAAAAAARQRSEAGALVEPARV